MCVRRLVVPAPWRTIARMPKRRRSHRIPRPLPSRPAPAPSTPRPALETFRARPILAALAAALAGFAYVNGLHNPFVYDDRATVVTNPSLGDLTGVKALLLHSAFRPVLNVSYALDHALWGLQPFGYHVTGVLLHMANVVLVFWLTTLAVDDWRGRDRARTERLAPGIAAFTAAALFAVHPMMTGAVGYVSGRSEVLCATFVLLGLLALRAAIVRRQPAWLVPGVAAWVLGLGTKEVAAVLPLVLLAWDRLLLADGSAAARRRLVRLHLPLVGAIAAGGLARLAVFLWIEPPVPVPPAASYIAAQPGVIWRYLALLVVPASQSLVHEVEVSTRIGAGAMAAATGLIVVGALAVLARRQEPVVALGAAWFFLGLAPSSLVPLNEPMVEHRVYLASIGVFLAAGAGAARLAVRLEAHSRGWRMAGVAALATVLAMLFALTVARNAVWADPVTLWREAARKAPGVWYAHFGLGNALADAGRCGEAIDAYRATVRLSPQGQAFMNLGTCLAGERRLDEARRAFEQALEVEPTYVVPHYNLALLALARGDRATAHRHLVGAIPPGPRDAEWRRRVLATHAERISDPRLTLELCLAMERVAPGMAEVLECILRGGRR